MRLRPRLLKVFALVETATFVLEAILILHGRAHLIPFRCLLLCENNFENFRFGVCFVTCSRPPRRDFKLSVGVHDVPKTSRTRCDNARTTTSPYEKVCVKFQNIYNQSKTTHRLEACFLFQTRNMYRRKKVFRSVQV